VNIDDNKETAQTSNPDLFNSSEAKALNTFFTACATTFIGRPKAIKYFVEFNKYKSRTRFNNCSYYILVMNQMPMHILQHIAECIPPPPDYETL